MPVEPYAVVTDWIVGDIPVYRVREARTGAYLEFDGSTVMRGLYGTGPATTAFIVARAAVAALTANRIGA